MGTSTPPLPGPVSMVASSPLVAVSPLSGSEITSCIPAMQEPGSVTTASVTQSQPSRRQHSKLGLGNCHLTIVGQHVTNCPRFVSYRQLARVHPCTLWPVPFRYSPSAVSRAVFGSATFWAFLVDEVSSTKPNTPFSEDLTATQGVKVCSMRIESVSAKKKTNSETGRTRPAENNSCAIVHILASLWLFTLVLPLYIPTFSLVPVFMKFTVLVFFC